MPRSEFIQLCIQESLEAADQFKTLWQKMGLSADWNLVYSTMSDSSRALSQKSFIELYKKGYIYREQEPAIYCSTCRTSVAQAELDDKEVPSIFNDIIFKDAQGNNLTVATTRPELLPACAAVLYHPADARYQHLRGTSATVPLFNYTIPFIEDDLVNKEKGTGLVMVCTFGDKTDIIWYKKHNLAYKQVIGLDGKCTDNAEFLAGLKVAEARTVIIEKLRDAGLLVNQKPITHTVGVHERCKKEIEFIIIPQWFISILPHKHAFLDMADKVNWYPQFMKSRYVDWVKNLAWDWGISRQRFYGIPFPTWHCTDCRAILLADEAQLPVDPQETAYNKPCPQCGSSAIIPDTDVMDTWNTSSITPYICKNLSTRVTLPMDLRPQAHDIIRTWAFDTIVKTWMHDNIEPWKDIAISGHVLSDKKEKISKKDANGMEPEQLLANYPADAIRYWTASAKLGHDISFSDEQIKIGVKLINKLWNAFKFAQPHLEQFSTPNQKPDKLGIANEWLLHTISTCFEKYKNYLDQHEAGLALTVLEQFFWSDYCDNYIELTKNQLFNPHEYSADEVYATRWTLYHVGLRILQLYAPYLPHVTETIYQALYVQHEQTASIHQKRYTEIQTPYLFEQESVLMDTIIQIIVGVRKLKSEHQLSLKTPLEVLYINNSSQEVINALSAHNQLIQGITQAKAVIYNLNQITENNLAEQQESWSAHISCS
jgi:valyl-tRNA synthetase